MFQTLTQLKIICCHIQCPTHSNLLGFFVKEKKKVFCLTENCSKIYLVQENFNNLTDVFTVLKILFYLYAYKFRLLVSAVIDSDDKETDKSKIRQKDTAAGQNVIDKTEGKSSAEESSKKYITKLTTFCFYK